LTDKISDSDGNFYILRDIKPFSFEPLAKKVTDSINCEELAAASAYVDIEQPPVPPTGLANGSFGQDILVNYFFKVERFGQCMKLTVCLTILLTVIDIS